MKASARDTLRQTCGKVRRFVAAVMTRIRWTADRSGVAHAHQSGRTACHAEAIAERHAWPAFSRCPACVVALAKAGR